MNDIIEQKKKALISVKKAKSVLEKVIQMMDDDEYCIDIMQQNLAAIGLLKSAHQTMMENHLNSCFYNAMQSKQDKKKQEMISEILQVSKLSSK